MKAVLLDTGPLVAFLDRRDEYHDWAKEQWMRSAPPLFTCEAVMTEACFLLRKIDGGIREVMKALEVGAIAIQFRLDLELDPVTRLIRRYENIPMSLADACLVRMSEIHSGSTVMTLDSDFRTYRRRGRQVIPLMIPSEVRRRRR